ncbi:MAG: YcdB/YcdC domain-containing protein [Eubacteriales bacterium]|jgi:Zn-dependent metalloprotease
MKNRKIIALAAVMAAILMAFTAAMPSIAEAPAEEPVAYEPIATEPAVAPGIMPPPPTEDYILISGEVDDSDAGAAKAILLAKKYFGETDDYKTVDTWENINGNLKIYEINWRDSDDRPGMNAAIGTDGVVYSWQLLLDFPYESTVIPDITMKEAAEKALAEIDRLYPEISSQFSLENSSASYSRGGYFTVRFNRVLDGMNVDSESISVSVDSKGKVFGVYNNATAALTFPDSRDFISDKEISDSFKKNLPMELGYLIYTPKGSEYSKIGLFYTPNKDYQNTLIDLSDGSAAKYRYGYSYNKYNMFAEEAAAAPEAAAGMDGGLTEAEQESVELLDTFIKANEAAKTVLENEKLYVIEGMKLISSYLRKQKSAFDDSFIYIWNLSFKSGDNYAYATVDAESGKLLDYSGGSAVYSPAEEFKYSKDECFKIGREFAEDYFKDIISEYKENDYENYDYTYVSSYNVGYTRYVNGLKFTYDYIDVAVSPENGKISGFSSNYSKADFPDPKKAVSSDIAADTYLKKAGITRKWVLVNIDDESPEGEYLLSSSNTSGKEVKAMAVSVFSRYIYIDAIKNKPADIYYYYYYYEDEPTVQYYEFSDVAGTKYEKQINRLANMEVIRFAKKFNPDTAIKEADLRDMIGSAGRGYYYPVSETDSELRDKLSRAEAVKCIIKALGWAEVASHSEIFTLDKSYLSNVDNADIGFIAIAKAFGLLDIYGGSFDGARTITRGEAAAIVSAYIDYLANKN